MKKLIVLAILAVGCQTAPTTMQEPDRTGMFRECLAANLHVTTCECMEAAAVTATGERRPLYDYGYPSDQVIAFSKALEDSYAGCAEKTKKILEENEKVEAKQLKKNREEAGQ